MATIRISEFFIVVLQCDNSLCNKGTKRNADEEKNLIINFFRLHVNYSNFFNSSMSGNACFNFSGISSEVLYVATPNGLS